MLCYDMNPWNQQNDDEVGLNLPSDSVLPTPPLFFTQHHIRERGSEDVVMVMLLATKIHCLQCRVRRVAVSSQMDGWRPHNNHNYQQEPTQSKN